jgi:CheY-like chemotaxis protein
VSANKTAARRILVVDDNKEVADATVMMLKRMGHSAQQTYDGTAAMGLAVSYQPDFIFIDLVMPGMDGLELARELHAMFTENPPKMIALTAFPQPAFRDAAKWAGFDGYLMKPATLEQLAQVLAG